MCTSSVACGTSYASTHRDHRLPGSRSSLVLSQGRYDCRRAACKVDLGRTFGERAFGETPTGVHMTTDESFAGETVEADVTGMQSALDSSLAAWLAHLPTPGAALGLRPPRRRSGRKRQASWTPEMSVGRLTTQRPRETGQERPSSRYTSAPQMMTGAVTGPQIGSECLVMPDTCPGQPTARRLACSARGSFVP
jgi:hypothetical protein